MSSPSKLSLIVFSGSFEKVHYALVMASAAVATDRAVTLFFTMEATRALLGSKDQPGWRTMPSEAGGNGGGRDDAFRNQGVGTFEDLLGACAALDCQIMVCEMGLRAMGLSRDDLRDDIPIKEGGVVTFLNDADQTGQIVFI